MCADGSDAFSTYGGLLAAWMPSVNATEIHIYLWALESLISLEFFDYCDSIS